MTFFKTYCDWRGGWTIPWGLAETLERAPRMKRLIERPQEALLCAKA